MKIICDIDNVIVDWQMAWIRKYENEFNRVPWAARGRWDCYATGTHFTTYPEFSEWLGEEFWFNANYERVPNAALWLRQAVAEGHSVLLATHRPEGAPQLAAKTLADRLGVPVVFREPLEKAELNGDVWIDDAPQLLWELKRQGKTGIRFVCPWNEGAPGIAMDCWSQFSTILKQLEEGE